MMAAARGDSLEVWDLPLVAALYLPAFMVFLRHHERADTGYKG